MSAPSDDSVQPPVVELTGPLLLGHLFNWGLFGVLIVQAYIYYLAFPLDRQHVKILAVSIFVLEVAQTVLATRDAFRNFGAGFGNMEELDKVGLLWISAPVMSGIISAVSQGFYAWRIWRLTMTIWIPILVISAVQAVAAIYSGANAHVIGVFSQVQNHNGNITSVWLGGTAACDIIIAATMSWLLLKSRTALRSTNVLLVKLVRLIVETGSICAAFAILDLAFFLRYKNNNYHLVPSIALSKLYSNSLFVLLNSRSRFLGGRDSSSAEDDLSLSLAQLKTCRTESVSLAFYRVPAVPSRQDSTVTDMADTRPEICPQNGESGSIKATVSV